MLGSFGKGWFQINHILFADDTAIVADSEGSCVDWRMSLVV